jgi:hypothetical protein
MRNETQSQQRSGGEYSLAVARRELRTAQRSEVCSTAL